HAPGAAGNGKVCPRTVEFLGIYPTLVELCRLPKNDELQGASLVPLLNDPKGEWKPAFTVLRWGDDLGKSVRTEKWRYSEWNGGENGKELYDHETDPLEITNLAHEPKYAGVVIDLKRLLKEEGKGLKIAPRASAEQKQKKSKK